MLSFGLSGHRRAAGQRDPADEAGHADAAGGQGRAPVRPVRVRRSAAAAGRRLSGAQLAPAGDHVAGGHRALQPGREEEAQEGHPVRTHVQRERHRGQGQRRLRGRRRIAARARRTPEPRWRRRWTPGRRQDVRPARRLGTAHVTAAARTASARASLFATQYPQQSQTRII